MSKRERHAEIVRKGLEAYNREDVPGVLRIMDPDVESRVGEGLMNTGTWHGLDGFAEMATTWAEAWGQNLYDIVEVETPDEDHVIARIHQQAIGAQSGVPVELTVFYMLEFADELVVRFHVYPDREAALAAIQ
ncbi:MAG: nuclear transport factor 2 family protein [Solirubrobacterales bacterium]